MKYRIKQKVKCNGTSFYYPQIKKWYGWRNLYIDAYDTIIVLKANTLESAKDLIDKDYDYRMSRKTKKVNHIKYSPITLTCNDE